MHAHQKNQRIASAWTTRGGTLVVLMAAFAILAGGVSVAAPVERPSEFDLSNGLKVVVVPDHRVPIVTHMVFYKIGSVDEAPGEEGLAHYLEHMMFMGTPTFGRGEFDRFVMAGGGMQNATTTQDRTTYFQRLPRNALEHLMLLEADRMENLQFTENAALNERNVVMEEFRGNAGQPGFPFFLATSAALYPGHPYGLPPIGNEAGISRFDGAKALAFYRRHYAPQRAIVVIGGDVTEEEARVLAERTYGRVKRRDVAAAGDRPLPLLAPTAQRVVVPHPRVSAVHVSRTFLTASATAMPIHDTTALSLFTYIVGDGMMSRLYRALVTEGLASGVSGGNQLRRFAGHVTFEVAALPGISSEVIEAAFDRALADIAEKGVTQSEFDDIKQRFLATRVYDEDNTASRSEAIGSMMIAGWSLKDILGFKQRIEKVSIEDVNRVGQGLLKHSRSVTGLLVPQPAQVSPVKLVQ
jgi:zinc protease